MVSDVSYDSVKNLCWFPIVVWTQFRVLTLALKPSVFGVLIAHWICFCRMNSLGLRVHEKRTLLHATYFRNQFGGYSVHCGQPPLLLIPPPPPPPHPISGSLSVGGPSILLPSQPLKGTPVSSNMSFRQDEFFSFASRFDCDKWTNKQTNVLLGN